MTGYEIFNPFLESVLGLSNTCCTCQTILKIVTLHSTRRQTNIVVCHMLRQQLHFISTIQYHLPNPENTICSLTALSSQLTFALMRLQVLTQNGQKTHLRPMYPHFCFAVSLYVTIFISYIASAMNKKVLRV